LFVRLLTRICICVPTCLFYVNVYLLYVNVFSRITNSLGPSCVKKFTMGYLLCVYIMCNPHLLICASTKHYVSRYTQIYFCMLGWVLLYINLCTLYERILRKTLSSAFSLETRHRSFLQMEIFVFKDYKNYISPKVTICL
jgi:hypothetical protein